MEQCGIFASVPTVQSRSGSDCVLTGNHVLVRLSVTGWLVLDYQHSDLAAGSPTSRGTTQQQTFNSCHLTNTTLL